MSMLPRWPYCGDSFQHLFHLCCVLQLVSWQRAIRLVGNVLQRKAGRSAWVLDSPPLLIHPLFCWVRSQGGQVPSEFGDHRLCLFLCEGAAQHVWLIGVLYTIGCGLGVSVDVLPLNEFDLGDSVMVWGFHCKGIV